MRAKAGAKRNASLADKASQVGAVSRRVEQALAAVPGDRQCHQKIDTQNKEVPSHKNSSL
jgi:hypothetical protein